MVVDKFQSGNATVYIHDDCITHDPAEIKRILDSVTDTIYNILLRQAMEKLEAKAAM